MRPFYSLIQKNGYTFATVYFSKCVTVFLNQTLFNFSDALSTTEQGQIVSASSSSLRSQNYLDNVIQWNVVVKRYRDLKSETPGKDNDD